MRSASCRFGIQNERDRVRELLPFTHFARELLSAERGEFIESRRTVVRRGAPARSNPLPRLQALKCRIERAVVNKERFARGALDSSGDALAVLRTAEKRAQDEQVKRPLEEGDAMMGGDATVVWSFYLSLRSFR
jgi:hypothetical protein